MGPLWSTYLDPTILHLPRHRQVDLGCTGCHKCLPNGILTVVNHIKQIDSELADLGAQKQEIENRIYELGTRLHQENRVTVLQANCKHPTVCSKEELEYFQVKNNTQAQFLCFYCKKHIPTSDVNTALWQSHQLAQFKLAWGPRTRWSHN
eukprot:2948371-Rhodomonas_salina.2